MQAQILTLLHSEKPKLYAILVFLSAIGLKSAKCAVLTELPNSVVTKLPNLLMHIKHFYSIW